MGWNYAVRGGEIYGKFEPKPCCYPVPKWSPVSAILKKHLGSPKKSDWSQDSRATFMDSEGFGMHELAGFDVGQHMSSPPFVTSSALRHNAM